MMLALSKLLSYLPSKENISLFLYPKPNWRSKTSRDFFLKVTTNVDFQRLFNNFLFETSLAVHGKIASSLRLTWQSASLSPKRI